MTIDACVITPSRATSPPPPKTAQTLTGSFNPIFLRVKWGVERGKKKTIPPRPSRRVASPPCTPPTRARAMSTPGNYQAISDAERGVNPPVPWADGCLDFFSDCEVCLWGCCPLGCYQSLFAWNATDAGTEDFHPALLRVCGLTVVVPNLLGFVASTAPSLGPAVQPLSTANQLLFAWYGMTHRQKMRRRHNIKGTDCGLCSCFSCLCEGDDEKIEDFCLYLCCAPCATCQETRHLRRWGITTRWRPKYPYDANGRVAGIGGGSYQAPPGQAMDVPVAPVAPGK